MVWIRRWRLSNYTTQVRYIVENYTYGVNLPISQRIELALPKIFDFDFPIYDEKHRKTLEKKIIMHYFNKEIGLETVGLWKFYLEEKLNLIMPEYNMLYQSAAETYDMLTDINSKDTYTETIKRDKNETTDSKVTGTANGTITNKGTENRTGTDNYTDDMTGKTTHSNTRMSETTLSQNTKDSGTSSTSYHGMITDNTNTEGHNTDLISDLPQTTIQGRDYGTEWNNRDTTQKTTKTENNTNDTEVAAQNENIVSSASETHDTDTGNDTNTDKKIHAGTNKDDLTKDNLETRKEDSTNSTSGKLTGAETETRTFEHLRTGKTGSGSYAKLILEYRETILNIDKMIINDLWDLFMTVY